MKKHLSILLGSALCIFALVPLFAHAAIDCRDYTGIIGDAESFLCSFSGAIRFATGLLSGVAVLVFFWGLVKFIAKADDEKARAQGKNIMVWGIVALFVMFSVFGLVSFLQASFGTTESVIMPPRL